LSLLSDKPEVVGQNDIWARFAVITHDKTRSQFVFSARRWNRPTSSHICQLHLQGIFVHN